MGAMLCLCDEQEAPFNPELVTLVRNVVCEQSAGQFDDDAIRESKG